MKPALLQRLLQPLHQRVMLMIGRAVLQLVKDGGPLQTVQVSLLADEVRDDAEVMQHYGFTSHPLPGAEAVAASVGASRDHLVVIAIDDRRYRLRTLLPGEVALYTDEGDCIVLKRGGVIEVKAATKLRIDSPLVECTGDVQIAGSLQVDGAITSDADITAAGNVADQGGAKTMAGMRTAHNGHKHGTSPLPDLLM